MCSNDEVDADKWVGIGWPIMSNEYWLCLMAIYTHLFLSAWRQQDLLVVDASDQVIRDRHQAKTCLDWLKNPTALQWHSQGY